jgi:hypothetical protein
MGWEPRAETPEEANCSSAWHREQTLLPASCGKHASLFEDYHESFSRANARRANEKPRASFVHGQRRGGARGFQNNRSGTADFYRSPKL